MRTRTCAYQGVRNVSFSENFTYVLNGWTLTSYVWVFIGKNLLNSSLSWSKSSETNAWYRLLCFPGSHGFTQYFLFLVFETLLCFLICFINCKYNMFWGSVFKFVVRRSFLKKKINKKIFIENHKKIWEIVILTDRCIIKKMISKK